MTYTLIEPTKSYCQQLKDYRLALLQETTFINGASSLEKFEEIKDYLAYLETLKNASTCPEGYVPSRTYLYVNEDTNELLGIVNLRLSLNDFLNNFGGHIGYSIAPNYRKQGHGTNLLKLTLAKAKEFNINPVLITCLTTNAASEKVILNNGGIYQDTRETSDGKAFKRFYIAN